jgi:LacI family transcriptional regulator
MAYPYKRERIEAELRRWLASGQYAPGDRFPSDQELARLFKVTHVTVRGALKPLVAEGALIRHIGQGTVVSEPGKTIAARLGTAVAVAIPENTHSFFAEMLKGIESSLFPLRRPLLLAHTWELGEREEAAVQSWLAEGVRQMVLVPTVVRPEFYRDLTAAGVRVVLADRSVPDVDLPTVSSRDDVGAKNVTRLLLDLGHRRIVHLAGPEQVSTARDRVVGFRQAMAAAGVSDTATIVPAGFFMDESYQAMKRYLATNAAPDAVMACNDPAAVGAVRAIEEAGLAVPRDVSVVGYGDTDLARNFNLTSVRQFPERIGAEAIRLLTMPDVLRKTHSLQIDPEITLRGSTAARGS